MEEFCLGDTIKCGHAKGLFLVNYRLDLDNAKKITSLNHFGDVLVLFNNGKDVEYFEPHTVRKYGQAIRLVLIEKYIIKYEKRIATNDNIKTYFMLDLPKKDE